MNKKGYVAICAALSILVTLLPVFPAQGSRYVLSVYNASNYDVYHIYVSSSEVESWGPDQLESQVLRSGSTFRLRDIATGEYDVKFVDQDGDSCVLRRITVARDTSWKLTTEWLLRCEGYREHPRYSLSIQNGSIYDIHHLYVSRSTEENWGPDQLGNGILGAGSRFTITEMRGGEYDVKFVDQDGDPCVLGKIAISSDTSWRLTTAWLLNCESFAKHRR